MIEYAELMDAILTKAYCKPFTGVLLAKIQCLLVYYKGIEDMCHIQIKPIIVMPCKGFKMTLNLQHISWYFKKNCFGHYKVSLA